MSPSVFSTALWGQFSAAMDTLGNAIRACPADLWPQDRGMYTFWYLSHHTIFWLDFYLTASPETFSPPRDFGMTEMDPEGRMPNRIHSQEELLWWLAQCREKARDLILSMTEESASVRFKSNWMDFPMVELHLYNMRHVQHHAAQLNHILRQETNTAPGWVGRGKETSA